ncbi:zinc finger protein 8-like [Lycium barbarum]|uniref:zinc finger protein 8-like n=1 Tax=Lycium barbarum TaxID=112863 RepID=UPI00293F4A7D|nr:zinc finger protein 8-like [Lycium barbarum]
MEKTDRETRDFMNVESFSQLPFIHSPPPKEKAIRLFGKEFGAGHDNSMAATKESESIEADNNSSESSRIFECHYYCRNFPTSQAFGGHQNAHRRERQHAKRTHLQSAMVHGAFTEGNIYGMMNYRPTANYHHTSTWVNQHMASTRFYGSHHTPYSHQPPPINGSPLALWRIPPAATSSSSSSNFGRERSIIQSLPIFAANEDFKPSPIINTTSTSQRGFRYETNPGVQDYVSLDLHL